MGLRDDKKKETTQRILAIAASHFLRMPYDDVKLAEISQEADIAEGTLYNYFKDKTTLFLTAFSMTVIREKPDLVFKGIPSIEDGIKVILDALAYYLRIDDPSLRQVFKSFYHHQKGQLLARNSDPFDALEALTSPLYKIINEVIGLLVHRVHHPLFFQVIKRQIEGIFEAYLYLDWPFGDFIAETRRHLEVLLALQDVKYLVD